MSIRLFALLVFSLSLAGCGPAPGSPERSVAVTGEGEISAAPEVATVLLYVQARAREIEPARQRAGEVVTEVLALTDTLGISREQVQASQLAVNPEFDWNEGRQTLRGYLVEREIRVELEDLAQLGPLMERAMQAGVNRIAPPELRVREPRKLHREVLQLAAEDARANAESLSKSLGARLGEARRVETIEQNGPIPFARMERQTMASDAQAEQSYEKGMILVKAKVLVEFELR